VVSTAFLLVAIALSIVERVSKKSIQASLSPTTNENIHVLPRLKLTDHFGVSNQKWSQVVTIPRQPSEEGAILFMCCLDVYHTPPDSGERQCTPRI